LSGQAAPGGTAWNKETAMSDSESSSNGSILSLTNWQHDLSGLCPARQKKQDPYSKNTSTIYNLSKARKSPSNLRKVFIPILALAIYAIPSIACADPFLMLHYQGERYPALETRKQKIQRSVKVGINENGDLIIRRSDISLIVAYNPPNDIIDNQDRIKIAQRYNCPAISGISLKICLLF
jgi:hypothetical protein